MMAIEVIRAGITFPEQQLATAQNALAFVLAGAELELAREAYNLLERKEENPLNIGIAFNRAPIEEPFLFEVTDTNDTELAGLVFVGDDETQYDTFAQLLTGEPLEEDGDDDAYGPFYSGEQWPALVRLQHSQEGIVHAVAYVAVHALEDRQPADEPAELSALKANASEGADRLTVAALQSFMISLRAS